MAQTRNHPNIKAHAALSPSQGAATPFSRLDDLRESCAWVAQRATHVRIRTEKIPDYIVFLLDRYPLTTGLDDNHFVSRDAEKTASYILALDSLNFGSGYFRQARDEGVAFSYTHFARGLRDAFTARDMDTPEKWSNADARDFHRIFNIPLNANVSIDQLFTLFAQHLGQTGRIVQSEYGGRVLDLVNAACGSAERLVKILATWPTFHDISLYQGKSVPLLKRAQICAADMHLASLVSFHDIEQLTVFADNRVPHVLRCDGVLDYSADLARKIDGLASLSSGSPEEIELRAVTIHAAELMKAAAIQAGRNVTSVNIDHILWHRGAEPDIKNRPTHRTLTTWY